MKSYGPGIPQPGLISGYQSPPTVEGEAVEIWLISVMRNQPKTVYCSSIDAALLTKNILFCLY
jgi:hypothetical protein